MRRKILPALFGLLTFSLSAHAQDYPNRMIKMIHGFPPGGNVDIIARLLGRSTEQWEYIDNAQTFMTLQVCPIGLERPRPPPTTIAANTAPARYWSSLLRFAVAAAFACACSRLRRASFFLSALLAIGRWVSRGSEESVGAGASKARRGAQRHMMTSGPAQRRIARVSHA